MNETETEKVNLTEERRKTLTILLHTPKDRCVPKSNKLAVDVFYLRKLLGKPAIATVIGEGYQITEVGRKNAKRLLETHI